MAENDDIRYSETSRCLQGTAKVGLHQFVFDQREDREYDESNARRLVNIFKKEGCHNLASLHRIPVIVSEEDLRQALHAANIETSCLRNDKDPPLLVFPTHVQALHGKHRVAAGRTVLAPQNRCWAVDIYLNDISVDLKQSLVEEYTNEKPFSDGHIYYKIRQAQLHGDTTTENRWKARLCANSQCRLKYFLTSVDLRNALDMVISIPGNRFALRISMFHRLQAIRCNEEICHYLKYIYDTWLSFVGERRHLARISESTVQKLQLIVPICEQSRLSLIREEVLTEFSDEERRLMWEKLRNFDGVIPSLYSFYQDFKILESWAACLKRLVDLDSGQTVRQGLESIWTGYQSHKGLMQISETEFVSSSDMTFGGVYRQMWLFAMRHYQEMPKEIKKSDTLVKSIPTTADQNSIFNMAKLGYKLGFRSAQVDSILKESPDRAIAADALLKARRQDQFTYKPQEFDSLIQRIVECFDDALPITPSQRAAIETPLTSMKHRCGYPTCETTQRDMDQLFLDRIDSNWSLPSCVTSLLVRHCVYVAFFGLLREERELSDSPMKIHQSRQHSPSSIDSQSPKILPTHFNKFPNHPGSRKISKSVALEGEINDEDATQRLWRQVLDQEAQNGTSGPFHVRMESLEYNSQNAAEDLWGLVLNKEVEQEPAGSDILPQIGDSKTDAPEEHPARARTSSDSTSSISTTRVKANRGLALKQLQAIESDPERIENAGCEFVPLVQIMEDFRRSESLETPYKDLSVSLPTPKTTSVNRVVRDSWETASIPAQGTAPIQGLPSEEWIAIRTWKVQNGTWNEMEPYFWDPSRAEQLQKVVLSHNMRGYLVCNGFGRVMTTRNCCEAIKGKNVMLLIPPRYPNLALPRI